MGFLLQPIWWILLIGASVLFAAYARMGGKSSNTSVGMITRTGFVALVVVGFIVTGWQGGLALCIVGAVLGFLIPHFVHKILVSPVSATPTRPRPAPRASDPLGRRAILMDMISSGINREKVWGLINQGRLIAYEDPKDGRISLVRPEDAAALRETEHEDKERDTG